MAAYSLCRVYSFACPQHGMRLFRSSSISYKLIQFLLSDIGEGIREVEVKDWFVKVGDKVSQFEDICLVESDKASVNISSRYDGVIKRLYYNVGDKAAVGKPLVDIETGGAAGTSDQPQEHVGQLEDDRSKSAETKTRTQPVSRTLDDDRRKSASSDDSTPDTSAYNRPVVTPSIRRLAMEHNIRLSDIQGSGKNGRIMKEDVEKRINDSKPIEKRVPHIRPPPKAERVEIPSTQVEKVEPIKGIRKIMVKTMTKSNSIPPFLYCDNVNMNNLIKLRSEVKEYAKKKGIGVTYMPFFVKAMSKSLEQYPILNTSFDENSEDIIYNSHHNIGFALDTKGGLVVPNVKNVQNLSIIKVGMELNRLVKVGRDMKLTPRDLTGGTITITNIGMLGGTFIRPLILPPEVCIVALGRIIPKPTFNEKGEIVKSSILVSSWAVDNRVIDRAAIANFANLWKYYIENPSLLVLDL